MPIWKAASYAALITVAIAWTVATAFTVVRQRNRVACFYVQTVNNWDVCTQPTELEVFVKNAYLPLVDL